MAIGHQNPDFAPTINSVYKFTMDLSGWDKAAIQVIGPVTGTLNVQASNNPGATLATQGNYKTAQDFTPVQVTNLATGTASPYIYGPGLYKYDVNAQFMRVQATPAAAGTFVYSLLVWQSKID